MLINSYTLSYCFHLSDLKSGLPVNVRISNDRIIRTYVDSIPETRTVDIITNCDPKQPLIPYPDHYHAAVMIDIYLAQISAIESLYKCQIPDYARYVRILLLELHRILNHFDFFISLGNNIQFQRLLKNAYEDSQCIRSLIHSIEIVHPLNTFFSIGGISTDIPTGLIENLGFTLAKIDKKLIYYKKQLLKNVVLVGLLVDVGIITEKDAEDYALSGPNLKASSDKITTQKTMAYPLYEDIENHPVEIDYRKGSTGDSWSRCWIRYLEIENSIRIIRQVMDILIKTEIILSEPPIITKREVTHDFRFEGAEGIIRSNIVKSVQDFCLTGKHHLPFLHVIKHLGSITENCQLQSLSAVLASLNLNSAKYFLS